jgi:hypothetical protein
LQDAHFVKPESLRELNPAASGGTLPAGEPKRASRWCGDQNGGPQHVDAASNLLPPVSRHHRMATYAMSREASVTRGDTRRLRIVERSSESAPGSAMAARTVTLLPRLGAGDRPARRHDLDSGAPPWILRYPQALFSRPGAGPVANPPNGSWPPTRMGREILACRRAIKSRCQRSTVSGRTSRRTLRRTSRGSRCSRRRATPGQPRWSGLSRRAVGVREPRSGAAARGLNRLAGRDARYGRIAPASWPGSPFPTASTSKLPGGSLADPVIASVPSAAAWSVKMVATSKGGQCCRGIDDGRRALQ